MIFACDATPSEIDSTVDFAAGNLEDLSLIPKPPGEAGRHSTDGREGYNLRDALKWDDAFYQEIMVRTFVC
jgi:hypothetical protein